MVEARKPTREQIGQHRRREEEFERAAAELRPQWAPGTVGDAMADFQAAAAAEQAEEAEQAQRLSVLPIEPSIVVADELVRAAQAAPEAPEPARAPKRRDAYPETYVGFAPTRPDADDDTTSRASASSYGVQSAFAPGESVNAVPGAFAPSGFPALDDASSKSRLSQLGGGSVASLAKRHGKLIAIVAGACLLLGVLVALFSGSDDDAPAVVPQAAPAAPEKPPVAVTPLPVVEPPVQAKPVQAKPEPTRAVQPAAKKAPVARAPVKAAVKAPVAKPVAKAPLKAAPKAAVKPVAKAPVKTAKPVAAKPAKGKPVQPTKRERSPIDVLNPWGS